MTIASDFYEFLWTVSPLTRYQQAPGSPGRKLHNRIAELEEGHALLAARYADLEREFAGAKSQIRRLEDELSCKCDPDQPHQPECQEAK